MTSSDSQLPPPAYEPGPPAAQPARTLAALLVLVVVFVVGVAVGSTGALGRPTTSAVRPSSAPPASGAPTGSAQPSPPSDFDLFWQALDIVHTNFVGRTDVTDQQLTYGAIRGMIEALGDTGHSIFLTPEQAQSEQNALDQNVLGIGVLLGERGDQVVVVSVVPDSPAQRAGIKAGDTIVAVDGQTAAGLSPEQLVTRVRGDAGTTVEVTVSRPPDNQQLVFSIVRDRIRVPAASWTMVPGTQVGLLRLSQFSAGSADELKTARDAAVAAGATSFVVDLRGNPGGYVDQAVNATSLFLRDKVVYIRETAAGERIPVETNDDVPTSDLPVVVLIDQNTASSAEIMSGALKAAGVQLVGETTFGTGTVLLPFTLADGSVVRLAVERWLTPEGELIFGKGISPTDEVALGTNDVPVEPVDVRDLTPDQVATLTDRQLLKAIELLGGPPVGATPAASP